MDTDLTLMKQLLTMNETIEELKFQRDYKHRHSTSSVDLDGSDWSVSETDMYGSDDDDEVEDLKQRLHSDFTDNVNDNSIIYSTSSSNVSTNNTYNDNISSNVISDNSINNSHNRSFVNNSSTSLSSNDNNSDSRSNTTSNDDSELVDIRSFDVKIDSTESILRRYTIFASDTCFMDHQSIPFDSGICRPS